MHAKIQVHCIYNMELIPLALAQIKSYYPKVKPQNVRCFRMLDHEGAAVLDKCMVEQPACVLGESSTGVEADDQLKQLVRTVKLARQSCHPGQCHLNSTLN